MAKITCAYDTENGDWEVAVDGEKVPGVHSCSFGYDDYTRRTHCSITTMEDLGGNLKKYGHLMSMAGRSIFTSVRQVSAAIASYLK
jgi:hypothetical protein